MFVDDSAPRPERAERSALDAPNRPKRSVEMYRRPRPYRAATQKIEHVYELERAGESEWTPWIAIAALILFYVAIGLFMFGAVEAGSHLLASASS